MSFRIVAGVRLKYDVGVAWFSVDLGGDRSVLIPCYEDIKKSDLVVLLNLTSEFDSRVDFIEAFHECVSRVDPISSAAEAEAAGLIR